jgi:undecaprenyl-diphosphatase
MNPIEILKAVAIGLVQGITEWLPVSSTGHMILFNGFIRLDVSAAFWELFLAVIQLGSILAVAVLFFHRLNPFSKKKSAAQKRATLRLWSKVLVAVLPAAVMGLLLGDWIETYFYNGLTVAAALVVYGVAFIVIEKKNGGTRMSSSLDGKNRLRLSAVKNENKSANAAVSDDKSGLRIPAARKEIKTDNRREAFPTVAGKNGKMTADDVDYRTALLIGCFQMLALIPGTSRSGSTVLGAMLLGVSRVGAAEFSFFMAMPVMLGASALKLFQFGFSFTADELVILAAGTGTAFLVSLAAIRFLLGFIKKYGYKEFGYYRIALGVAVIGLYMFGLLKG